jgi:hypothetical protein
MAALPCFMAPEPNALTKTLGTEWEYSPSGLIQSPEVYDFIIR